MNLQINVTSDFICPWCLLGKRRLEKAIVNIKQDVQNISISFSWFPYFVAPKLLQNAHSSTLKKQAYLHKFKGDTEKMTRMVKNFQRMYKDAGIGVYSLQGPQSHSLHAHRLVEYAKTQLAEEDLQDLVDDLFLVYHIESKSIAALPTLLDISARYKMDSAKVETMLKSKEYVNQVLDLAVSTPQEKGITGVPYFEFTLSNSSTSEQLRFFIPGAQDVEYFERILRKMIEKISSRSNL